MGRAKQQQVRKVQPPRPPNAWILYRAHQYKLIRERNEHERLPQATISKLISSMWKDETPEVKRQFEKEAERKKAEHQVQFPGYRFCPQRKVKKVNQTKSQHAAGTPSSDDEEADDDDVPPLPSNVITQQAQSQARIFLPPGYPHNIAMPQAFVAPYLPEIHYGPGGPSPPISAAPSPPQTRTSPSPAQSPSTEDVTPSSSTPSAQSSLRFVSQPTYFSPLPNPHQPWSNHSEMQRLSTLLYQNSTPSEPPLTSSRLQLAENTVAPRPPPWSDIPTYLETPDAQSSEEVANLDAAVSQVPIGQQTLSLDSSFEGLLSRTDCLGVFDSSMVESSTMLSPPNGDLEVVMGPEAHKFNYDDAHFPEFGFEHFEREIIPLTDDSSSCAHPSVEDLQSLFQIPNRSEFEAYATARQRQPSVFSQDMMSFINFEAANDSSESTSPVSSLAVGDPTVVAPQQVRSQSPQATAAIPILTQMTNTPTVTSGTPYILPAGYSSTHQAGSWKSTFDAPHIEVDNSIAF